MNKDKDKDKKYFYAMLPGSTTFTKIFFTDPIVSGQNLHPYSSSHNKNSYPRTHVRPEPKTTQTNPQIKNPVKSLLKNSHTSPITKK